jgi:hypothetical protein
MELSTQAIVKYSAQKADKFDKLVLDLAQRHGGTRLFGGTRTLSLNEKSISSNRVITFKFPSQSSKDSFMAALSDFDEITFQENPWLKMAGMYKDNPLFDEVNAYMEASRQEILDPELI